MVIRLLKIAEYGGEIWFDSNKSILLSPIKVQEFRSTQNWIQKRINLRNVRISQASSMNVAAPNRRNIVDVPGCSNEQMDKLFDIIYENKINDEIVVRPSIRNFWSTYFFYNSSNNYIYYFT